jgi:formylglycine-generating enzyme required for sulfatase activity
MLDFGLAKFLGSTTITGMVLGTPTYIAPEQLKGDPSGPWTDLYATAVMAYRLLFGRSPFGESSADDIVNRKLAASFDPMAEVADRSLPSTVQAFFRRALAREPRDRYAGVAELRGGLEAALASLEAAQFVPMPARAQPSATLDRRAEPTSRRARQDRPAAVPETPPTQPARRIPALPGAPVVAADQQVELPNTTYPSQTGSMAATLVQRPQSAPAHRYPQSAGTAPRAPAIEAHSLEPVRRYRVFAWLLLLVVGIGGLAWILATSGLSFGRRPLQVTVNVGGAQISVGGEVLATSVAGEPVTVRLPMGADRIEIARSGYTSWVADLRDNVVESGQLLAKLSPEPSSGPDRVRVPGGPAWIGCLPGDDCQGEPPGSIAEVGTFDIDRTEVTVEAYQRCVKDGACKAPSGKLPEGCSLGRSGQAKHPMNCVTWEEARLYCAWAGKRLPSADEWEKAARGGCERQVDCDEGAARFPWGSAEPSCDLAVFDDGKSGAGCGARGSATPASRKGGESPDGAWDLAGNVAEWVDVWRAGKGSSVGGGVKGGGFTSFAKELAISTTLAAEPTLRAADLGFRCAVSP